MVLELDQGLPERLQCFQDLKVFARFWFLRMFLKLFGFKWVPGVLGGFPGKSSLKCSSVYLQEFLRGLKGSKESWIY